MPHVNCALRHIAVGLVMAHASVPAQAQQLPRQIQLADQGPRFLLASGSTADTLFTEDVSSAPVLQRRVTLEMDRVPLGAALAAVGKQAHLRFVVTKEVVPVDRPVTVSATKITVASALHELLLGTGLDVQLSADGAHAALVPRVSRTRLSLLRQQSSGTISGRVIDAITGTPITIATITVETTTLRTAVGPDGRYTLRAVPAGVYRISARALGYALRGETIRVVPDSTSYADFRLSPAATTLEQVVTTATGNRHRFEVGNAIGNVSADSVVPFAPVTTFNDLLSSRVPGVEVQVDNGLTGQAGNIRVRGINSLTVSNDPIIILDGARIDNTGGDEGVSTPANNLNNYSIVWGQFGQVSGSLTNLNPDEIQSLEVVKGPSAATLYGTDAANGVIVITTKHGQVGHLRVTAYTEQGTLTEVGGFPANYYAWGHSLADGSPTQCLLADFAAHLCAIDSVTHFDPLSDPRTSPFGTGYHSQYGLQLSGGTPTLRYFGSGDFDHEVGYLEMPAMDQQRLSAAQGGAPVPYDQVRPNALTKVALRTNLVAALADRGDLTVSGGYLSNNTRIPRVSAPVASAEFGQGFFDPTTEGYNTFFGPPSDIFALRGAQHMQRYTVSASGNWRPATWLSTRATAGEDFTSTFQDGLQLNGQGPVFGRQGARWNSRSDITLYSVDLGATATTSLTHDVRSMTSVGTQYNRKDFGQTAEAGTGLIPGSQTAVGATTFNIGELNQQNVVAGGYAEETIALRERLFLTGAVRADGSSAFGANFRTALYPKASASWVISQEPFLREAPWLTSLRLRAAYGASGVQPDPTASLTLMTASTVQLDGRPQNGAYYSSLGNPDLKPERQTEFETGIDAEVLNSRVQVEATYFNRESSDALVNVPIAQSVGVDTRLINIGRVRNRGVEGSLTTRVLDARAIGLDVTFTGSVTHNTLVTLAPGVSFISGFGGDPFRHVPGYPLYGAWGVPILGYQDANHDGILEPNEVTLGSSPTFIGPTSPTRQLSETNSLSLWGGRVRASTLFDYRGGFVLQNLGEEYRCAYYADCRAKNDPTTPLAAQADAVAYDAASSLAGYTQDATFLRWRELSVTLAAPLAWAHAAHARALSLTLSGRNIALWTRYRGPSPETIELTQNMAGTGDERHAYPLPPPARYLLGRLNLQF